MISGAEVPQPAPKFHNEINATSGRRGIMSRNIRKHARLGVLIGGTIFSMSSVPLCGQATNGIISGAVTDPSGAVLAGATVEVRNTDTGVARTVVTNEQGRYRVPELIVGQYDVQASRTGSQTSVQRDPTDRAQRTRRRSLPAG